MYACIYKDNTHSEQIDLNPRFSYGKNQEDLAIASDQFISSSRESSYLLTSSFRPH